MKAEAVEEEEERDDEDEQGERDEDDRDVASTLRFRTAPCAASRESLRR